MFQTMVTGVEIGPKSIKAVSVKYSKNRIKLVQYRNFTSHAYILDDSHTLDYQGIVNKLKRLKSELPIFGRRIAVLVPDSAVVSRSLSIDATIEEDDKEFAIYEAFATHSPISPQDLRIDFTVNEDKCSINEPKVIYQVYAARKEVVDERISVIRDAGLKPILIDTKAHSLLKVWEFASQVFKCNNWLLVHAGVDQTIVCCGGLASSPLIKTIPVGLNQESVSNLTQASSDSFKKHEAIACSIAMQVQLYVSSASDSNLEGIWVTGDSRCVNELCIMLEEQTKLTCVPLNPLKLVDDKKVSYSDENEGHIYSLALGIAIKGLCWRDDR
ncbi:type IV pilus assembly protein PilM [Vibrio sp. HN007]|uniref:type IV pilus assembly protein PilM n=1 Tax=Vibrio iocasae TaxID=3098914 RepID=UPI0035D4111A